MTTMTMKGADGGDEGVSAVQACLALATKMTRSALRPNRVIHTGEPMNCTYVVPCVMPGTSPGVAMVNIVDVAFSAVRIENVSKLSGVVFSLCRTSPGTANDFFRFMATFDKGNEEATEEDKQGGEKTSPCFSVALSRAVSSLSLNRLLFCVFPSLLSLLIASVRLSRVPSLSPSVTHTQQTHTHAYGCFFVRLRVYRSRFTYHTVHQDSMRV